MNRSVFTRVARCAIVAALWCASVTGAEPGRRQVTVVFADDATPRDVATFIADWSSVGVRQVCCEQTPNGAVLELPADLNAADLELDPLVEDVRP